MAERASNPDGGRHRWWMVWLAVGVVAIGCYYLVPLGTPASNVYYDVLGATSAVMIVIGARRTRPVRIRLWYLIAAGQAVSVLGDVTYGIYKYGLGHEPFPSPADALYLSSYPLVAAGLFILIRGRTSGRDRAGLTDAAIISTGLGLLSWIFFMRPIADDTSLGLTGQLVSLALPAGDVLLLGMLARLMAGPGARTASYRLLAAAIVLLLASDVAYAVLNTLSTYDGGIEDAGWLLSYVLFAAAALHPSARTMSEMAPDTRPRLTRWRLVLLACTSLLAPGVLIVQGLDEPGDIDWIAISAGAIALFLLVVARMSGLVGQVQDQAAQLAALAHNDALTGVPNRRAWDLELARAMATAHRDGTSLVVGLLDLDRFKRFNDHHGHQAGDRLLKEAAAAWRSALRETDMLARYGGEEFAVLVAGLPAERAGQLVQRLLAATPQGQTFSAGIAEWHGTETPEQLVFRADRALYEAKNAGRNRVVVDTTTTGEPAGGHGRPVHSSSRPTPRRPAPDQAGA